MAEAKQQAKRKARAYTVTLSDSLTEEIREVAQALGLPASTVRQIVEVSAIEALDAARNNVMRLVADHFSSIAAQKLQTGKAA